MALAAVIKPIMPLKAPPAAVVPETTSGYSAWIKGIGDWTNRRDLQSVSTANSTFTFDTGFKQATYGGLGGIDWTKTSAYDLVQVGVMGGYVNSRLKFNDPNTPTTFDYRGGLVGGTATYLNNGWFVDGLVKADFLTLDLNMPSIANFGTSSGSVRVTNVGGMGNAGYRYTKDVWFAETIGTLAYVDTSIGSTMLQGTTVNFGDGRSFRGAVGERFGTVFNNGPHAVEASLLFRVWDEWLGNNSATLLTAGPPLTVTDAALKDRPFGEVAGMLDVLNLGAGWSGFINGGVKFNNEFTEVSGKGGLRYQW